VKTIFVCRSTTYWADRALGGAWLAERGHAAEYEYQVLVTNWREELLRGYSRCQGRRNQAGTAGRSTNPMHLQRLLLPLFALTLACAAGAQTTTFTYQGLLTDNGLPYTGSVKWEPTLWDAADGGTQVAANSPATVMGAVANGLFTVPLDFGANFPGAERWLQLEVRTTLGPFTPLTPRQPVTAAPYAMSLTSPLPAGQLSGMIPSANLGGTYSGTVTFNNAANSFSGSGAGLTGLNASQLAVGTVPDARLGAGIARISNVWSLGGNAGTDPANQFIGTSDATPLVIRAGGQEILRLEGDLNGPRIIAGRSQSLDGSSTNSAILSGR
jgi:hypothetical protein